MVSAINAAETQCASGNMVYKRVLGHGLHFFGPKFCVRVDDPQCFFVEGSESHRTQVDVPNAVVDLLQAHVLAEVKS